MTAPLRDPSLRKLVHMMGAARAETVIAETLGKIGRPALETAQDRYRFGVELMRHGGVLGAIGRSIKIQALLLGAEES
jgi:hypothetical protein